jgi:PAS domain S-box-containing protein
MEIAHDLAIVLDLEGRLTYANPAASDILGYRQSELVGRFLWDIFSDLDRVGILIGTTLDYGQWGGEVSCTRRDGGRAVLRLRTVLVQTKEGEILGIVGIGWDITEKADSAFQLARFEQQRLVGEMVTGVAHNFNNILVSILGNAQILDAHSDLPPEVRELTDVILSSAEKASGLVRRIQRAAGAGQTEPSMAIRLADAVEACVEATRPRWRNDALREGRHITVEMDLVPTRSIDGRASEVDEVLTNLIFNAVDAMPAGGKITIRMWEEAGEVCLSVADTGIGMDADTLRRLGEPFYTTKGERGHGLGLMTSYQIVEGMSGRIEVESVPHRGSTFLLRFPAGTAKPAAPELARPDSLGFLRILIVEDDVDISDFLIRALPDCEVVVASDGSSGLERFDPGRYDVVLTDLSLPGKNGLQVARMIRERDPDVPVVLMSGYEEPPDGISGTVNAFLPKPFSLGELRRCLGEAVGD